MLLRLLSTFPHGFPCSGRLSPRSQTLANTATGLSSGFLPDSFYSGATQKQGTKMMA